MSPRSDRSLRVSEVFTSFQGEGVSAGASAVFLRLALCNLRCRWCDTPYSWDWSRFDYAREVMTRSVGDVARQLEATREQRLIVTGGEPLLQQAALEALFEQLGPRWQIEVETNGTVVPRPMLARRVTQWNVSPKLRHSGDPLSRRIRRPSLLALQRTGRAWLKIVITCPEDADEAAALVADLGWPAGRVLFMAEGSRKAPYERRAPVVAEIAARSGFGVSPRLHIARFDGERGR